MRAEILMPASEYVQTTWRPDREYLEGVLLERNVGERDHSRIQMVLSAFLYFREAEWGIRVFPEQRLQVKPERFRVPDICVVAGAMPDEAVFTQPPLLCVEILSKDDTVSEMQERIDDYLNLGVRFVWLIDPRMRRAWISTPEGMKEAKDGKLRTTGPDLEVPLGEIFETAGIRG